MKNPMTRKIINKIKLGMTASKANISGGPENPVISLNCSNWVGFVDSPIMNERKEQCNDPNQKINE